MAYRSEFKTWVDEIEGNDPPRWPRIIASALACLAFFGGLGALFWWLG